MQRLFQSFEEPEELLNLQHRLILNVYVNLRLHIFKHLINLIDACTITIFLLCYNSGVFLAVKHKHFIVCHETIMTYMFSNCPFVE
jgi:hypothetical protein